MVLKFCFLLSCTVFLVSIQLMSSALVQFQSVKDLIPPPPNVENYSVGFAPQIADVLWIRAIQDFDYCENQIAENQCKGNSWLYHMLDAITRLDPEYRMPYAMGALALSVLISDIEGASKLFDKSVIQFPTDWKILYRAAYHALLEEKDQLKAAYRFDQAANFGAPIWLKGLAGRLYAKEGRKEDVERLVQELSNSEENKMIAERMKRRIQKGE